MKTNVSKIIKIGIKSFFIFVLVLSVFFSSINISFASADAPSTVSTFDEVCPYEAAHNWVESVLEQDPYSYVMIWVRETATYTLYFVYVISADVSLYFDSTNQGVAASSRLGMVGKIYSSDGSSGDVTNQYPGNNSFYVDGTQYWYFNGLVTNASNVHTFYCSTDFKDAGGDSYANLDVSDLMPNLNVFNVWLAVDQSFIGVEVDFPVDTYDDVGTFPSYITLWGNSDFGGLNYVYSSSEYQYVQFDLGSDNKIHSTFYLDTSKIFTYYQSDVINIASLSCHGWSDSHEEYASVSWTLYKNKVPSDYDPPDNNYYYSSWVNENYSYNSSNGIHVAYGLNHLRCTNSAVDGFWDSYKTLVQPYNFNFIIIPGVFTFQGVDFSFNPSYLGYILDSLILSYDVIILDVNESVFNQVYGPNAMYDFYNTVDFTYSDDFIESFNSWYASHNPYKYPADYDSFVGSPWVYESSCGILYPDSFYYKSLCYLLGDVDDRLLEFSVRFFEEDGFANSLLKAMSSMYEQDRGYYSQALGYLNRLTYFTDQVLLNDYFGTFLSGLSSVNSHLNAFDLSFQSSISSLNSSLGRINDSILGLDLSFENITLEFPEFNFDIVVENHPTTNIEYFVDFVNNFFTALPDADYSPLEDIDTNFDDLFDELHVDDSSFDFLNSLLDSYEFSDSHLDDYD